MHLLMCIPSSPFQPPEVTTILNFVLTILVFLYKFFHRHAPLLIVPVLYHYIKVIILHIFPHELLLSINVLKLICQNLYCSPFIFFLLYSVSAVITILECVHSIDYGNLRFFKVSSKISVAGNIFIDHLLMYTCKFLWAVFLGA